MNLKTVGQTSSSSYVRNPSHSYLNHDAIHPGFGLSLLRCFDVFLPVDSYFVDRLR